MAESALGNLDLDKRLAVLVCIHISAVCISLHGFVFSSKHVWI